MPSFWLPKVPHPSFLSHILSIGLQHPGANSQGPFFSSEQLCLDQQKTAWLSNQRNRSSHFCPQNALASVSLKAKILTRAYKVLCDLASAPTSLPYQLCQTHWPSRSFSEHQADVPQALCTRCYTLCPDFCMLVPSLHSGLCPLLRDASPTILPNIAALHPLSSFLSSWCPSVPGIMSTQFFVGSMSTFPSRLPLE